MTTIKLFNNKTFAQMTDSMKQELAEKLVNREIYSNVGEMVSLISKLDCDVNEYHDELQELMFSREYEESIIDALNSNEIDFDSVMSYTTTETDELILKSAFEQFGTSFDDYNELSAYLDENETTLDFIETSQAIYNDIEKDDKEEEFCNEFSIEWCEDETLEFWAVSNWLAHKLDNTLNIGCTAIWGRGTSGQAICLDHQIQEIAFDLYSTEVDEAIHINKIDAIKAIITASVKPDMVEHVSKVILDNTTAYQLSINADGIDYEQRKTLETRITNNVKKVNKTLEAHNITL